MASCSFSFEMELRMVSARISNGINQICVNYGEFPMFSKKRVKQGYLTTFLMWKKLWRRAVFHFGNGFCDDLLFYNILGHFSRTTTKCGLCYAAGSNRSPLGRHYHPPYIGATLFF